MSFEPTDEQWEKMKKHIKSDKYTKKDFFVFETLAVGDKIVPNRYMRLTPALLNVMKEDAQKGVSLMLNHNWSQWGVQSVPIGKVFDGRISSSSQDGETTSLYTTQYILRDDSKVDGYSKDDIIKLIETGILSDTSIGWGTTSESYKCNICGHSIYDYRNCEHVPGKKYIVNEETNEVKQCIVQAEPPTELHAGNNVLMENSIVFDGAYPNAIIQSKFDGKQDDKGNMLKVLEGKQELSKEDIVFGYSTNGSINLLYKKMLEKGGIEGMITNNEEVEEVVEETEATETTENVENAEQATEEVVENAEETTEEATEETTETVEVTEQTEEVVENANELLYSEKAILEKFDNIADSLDVLVMLAKEGSEARNEAISSALESGVHSMGNAFNKNVFAKTFSNMSIKDINEMAKAWEEQASKQFSNTRVSQTSKFEKEEEVENQLNKKDLSTFKTGIY